MGAYMVFGILGIPCAIFLIYCLTPKGKQWLRHNNMI